MMGIAARADSRSHCKCALTPSFGTCKLHLIQKRSYITQIQDKKQLQILTLPDTKTLNHKIIMEKIFAELCTKTITKQELEAMKDQMVKDPAYASSAPVTENAEGNDIPEMVDAEGNDHEDTMQDAEGDDRSAPAWWTDLCN